MKLNSLENYIKKSFLLLFLVFNTGMVFSVDFFSYSYDSNVTYAAAIAPSKNCENEFTVGLLEIDPSGDERWTISTQSFFNKDKELESGVDVNFPVIRFSEDCIEVEINKKNNVVLNLKRVETLTYKNCIIKIPDIFY